LHETVATVFTRYMTQIPFNQGFFVVCAFRKEYAYLYLLRFVFQ